MHSYNTHRVLVDNGSFAAILYYQAFQQMRIEKERLIPTNAPLVGFGGTKVYPLGKWVEVEALATITEKNI